MATKEIKFFVKRIFTKDLSLESPDAPAIFDNIKSTPQVAFNLNTSIIVYKIFRNLRVI